MGLLGSALCWRLLHCKLKLRLKESSTAARSFICMIRSLTALGVDSGLRFMVSIRLLLWRFLSWLTDLFRLSLKRTKDRHELKRKVIRPDVVPVPHIVRLVILAICFSQKLGGNVEKRFKRCAGKGRIVKARPDEVPQGPVEALLVMNERKFHQLSRISPPH